MRDLPSEFARWKRLIEQILTPWRNMNLAINYHRLKLTVAFRDGLNEGLGV